MYASVRGMVVLLLFVAACYGAIDGTAGAYKVDFAVPDMPAFKALGTDPDDLIRPTDPKVLALMLADQTSTLRVIPQSFAAEFAPLRLFGAKRLTLAEYCDKRLLYDTRVSFGSRRSDDSMGGSKVAGGVRMTVGNGVNFVRYVVALRESVYHKALVDFALANESPSEDSAQENWDRLQERHADSVARWWVNDRIGELRDAYKDSWNRSTFDVAYAAAFTSPDSFTRELAPASHHAWVSWAFPVGSWFQGVVGGKGAYSRPDRAWALNYSTAGRLIGGVNEFKLHLEGQYKHDGAARMNTWLVGFGAEVMVFSGGWVDLTLDWEKDIAGSGTRFVPGIKYRFTTPESFTRF